MSAGSSTGQTDPYTDPALYKSVDTAQTSPTGQLEYVRPEPGGTYLVAKVVGDTVMYGNDTTDGGWISQAGPGGQSVAIDANGVVSHGITDPGTQQFLPNGSSKVIDGQTVYGSSVGGGDWLSESGTQLVTSSGQVETGKIVGGSFLSARTVDGTVMYGSDTTDGGWISQAGPGGQSVAIDANGVVSHGITDPGTQQFLPNGSIKLINGQQMYGVSTGSDGGWLSESGTVFVGADGTVWSGKLDDSTNEFVVQKDVNGVWMSGTPDDDGDWASLNGDVEIEKGKGPESGITDPTTHEFLPGGSIKTINGQQMYGYSTGSDGGWLSESGTVFVGADGTVWSGKLDDSTNEFVVQMDINGVWMSGRPDDGGGWTSLNGDVYKAKGQPPVWGLTDPVSGDFLQAGTEKTVDGQTYYGYMAGSDFISDTGNTVILANGKIITGTLDKTDGIFTAANGATFAVTGSGIVPATFQQSDGSYKLPDGSYVMTPESWAINLPIFADAIKYIQACANAIQDSSTKINQQLEALHEAWTSPAGDQWYHGTISPLVTQNLFQLNGSLESVISTMQQSYTNYVKTEQTNNQNSSLDDTLGRFPYKRS